jgi:hypothetical protein
MLCINLAILPYSVYAIVFGFRIVSGQKNLILLHYRILFSLLQLIRGKDYMLARREKFINSSEYKRQGWYSLLAGILLLIAALLTILDYAMTLL